MARKFLTNIDLNTNELQNAVVQNLSSAPNSGNKEGRIYYDTVTKKLRYYGASGAWYDLAAGGTAASTVTLTGDVNGTANVDAATGIITLEATIQPNSVALGTDTTGDYVEGINGTTGQINVSNSGGEGSTPTISLPNTVNIVSAINVGNDVSLTTNSLSIGTVFTVDSAGNIYVDGNADVNGNLSVGNGLDVTGATNISGNVNVTGNSVLTGTLEVTETATFDNGIITTSVSGDSLTLAATDGDVTISGDAVGINAPTTITATGTALTVSGNATITGNLNVEGTLNAVNREEINIEDSVIRLNTNVTGAPSADAGIIVERGSANDVGVIWNETNDNWTITNDGSNYFAVARKFVSVIGDASNTSFDVVHNLGTRDVTVQVYQNSADYDIVETDMKNKDANTVTVSFTEAPSLNAYRVVIVG